jgi:hypothetical protein
VKFAPGEALVRRHWRGGRLQRLHLVRVAADDEFGLRLWLPAGSPWWRLAAPDQDAAGDLSRVRLVREVWTGSDVLIWVPEQTSYAVCWRWEDGLFAGWRATLEEPSVRWADRGCAGVDTADQALGVVVRPDLTWRWRDEEELQARTGHPLYWTASQAAQIQATADRLVELVQARRFPFDGTWCGFRPDASWTVPALPYGYDRPRALAPRP